MNQPFLHEVIKDIIDGLTFPIRYKTAVDSGGGIFTLAGIKRIHHLQPGMKVTIGTDVFIVDDYVQDDCWFTITLTAGTNALPADNSTVILLAPFFKHGTPLQAYNELTKMTIEDKTPIIYLMEPYEVLQDYDQRSSVWGQIDATLCFLGQADAFEWTTDQFWHGVISPMVNLMNDFMSKMQRSHLFYTSKLKGKPVYHSKFGIYVREEGVKTLKWSEKFSGVSNTIIFEPYKIDDFHCCVQIGSAPVLPVGASFDGSFDNSHDNGES